MSNHTKVQVVTEAVEYGVEGEPNTACTDGLMASDSPDHFLSGFDCFQKIGASCFVDSPLAHLCIQETYVVVLVHEVVLHGEQVIPTALDTLVDYGRIVAVLRTFCSSNPSFDIVVRELEAEYCRWCEASFDEQFSLSFIPRHTIQDPSTSNTIG